jgi:uncharacterized membrane protein
MQLPFPSEDPAIKAEVRSYRLFAICLLFVGFLLAGTGWAWRHSPAGPVDHPGRDVLLVAPAIVALLSLAALPQPASLRARWRFSSRGLLPVWLAFFLLYAAGFHVLLILAVVGRPLPSTVQWMLGPFGIFYIVMGNNLSKCRDEFFFRVRTPWTIRSELSWNRTNRLGARMYVIGGLAICVSTFAGVPAIWLAILVGTFGMGSTAILWGYSYVLWRSDPEKKAFDGANRRNFAERRGLALRRSIVLAVLGLTFVWFGAHTFGTQRADWFSVALGVLILSYGISLFHMDRNCRDWALMRSIFLTVLGLAFAAFGVHTFGTLGAPLFVVLGLLLSGYGISQFHAATKGRNKLRANELAGHKTT